MSKSALIRGLIAANAITATISLVVSPSALAQSSTKGPGATPPAKNQALLPDSPQPVPFLGVALAPDFVAPTTPLSTRLRLQNHEIPTTTLPPVDVVALVAEDAQFLGAGTPLRIGIQRPCNLSLPSGNWIEAGNGMLWTMDLKSTGAVGVRLHFSNLNLPLGAELVVYSPAEPRFITGPVTSGGPLGTGEFWTGTAFGDTARIECYVPLEQFPAVMAAAPFTIDEVSHKYRNVFKSDDEGGLAVGACHNVPACFSPTWDNVRKAVGMIEFVDGGTFLCSGQLVRTAIDDQTPYFLTANHCVSSNAVANTVETFWKYERPTCAGSPTIGGTSNINSLVATYGTADETLMMVEGALPSNMFWVAWATAEPASGTASTGVHHPDGSYMRISFGTKSNSPNCGGSSTNFMLLSWSSGVTEGGSSGSGIFRNDNQQLYGTLTCGGSACSGGSGNGVPDSYGQFDRAYNAGGFSTHLAAGTDDALEQNDSCASPRALAAGTYNNNIVKSTDEDWYAITLGASNSLTALSTFTHANGNINMQLYNACGGSIVASSLGTGNSESFNYVNPGGTATFYLRVFLAADTRNAYNLQITISGPSNDLCSSGEVVVEDTPVAFSTAAAATDGPADAMCNFNGSSQITNDLYYFFIPEDEACTQTTVSVCGASYNSRIAVYQDDCPGAGTILACNDDAPGCGTSSSVTFPTIANTLYVIRVGGTNGATGSGTMMITCGSPPDPCPPDVDNDGDVDIDDFTEVVLNWGTADPDADITGDGEVDIDDYTEVILNWGPC